MKRSLWSNFAIAVLTGLMVLAIPAVSYADTSTLTLNIQARAGQVRTAKVRILLELAAPPDASTEIVVNNGSGAVTVTGVPGAGTTPDGDDILITNPGAGSATLTIFYSPRSRFANPNTNLCVPSALTEAQTVTMNYTGPHINSFRMSSYTVPKTFEADEGTCAQAFRRIRNLPPLLTVNNSTAPAAVNQGRLPLDIILVLDKSGSMSGGSPSKWVGLNNSIGVFTDLWETADADPDPGSGLDLSGDRLGLVYFDSTVTTPSFSGSMFINRGANPPGPTHAWQAILNDIAGRGPGGATAMGAGLQTAIDAYQNNMDPWKNDATIVLMTDGMQNVAPLVTLVGSNWQLDPPGAPPSKNLFEYGIPGLTVFFGSPDATVSNLLNGIARQMAGTNSIAGSDVEIEDSFPNQLVSALKGNTLSILDRADGTLAAGVSQSAPLPFLLDGSVTRSVITLSWKGGRSPLDLEIIPPGSSTKVTPVHSVNRPTYTVQAVDIPKSGPIGDWQVKVVRRSLPGVTSSAAASVAVPYHLSIYSVEGKLEYQFHFPTVNDGTGDVMVLATGLSYQGVPLKNLPNGAIKLRIERPAIAPGTLLHDTDVSQSVLNTEIAGGGDVTTPYDRKLAELARTGKLNGIQPQDLGTTFTLEDKGTSGDRTANDAVYSARFADTSRPGVYRFRITLEWDDPRTGRIRREETIERVVKVNSDPAASQVIGRRLDGGSVVLTVTPRDRFNNFYGPSNRNPIKVTLTGGGTVASITDPRQTGDYQVRIENIPPGANPNVVIEVDDNKIRDDKLSNLGGGGGNGGGTGFNRWGLSLHGGVSIPHGALNSVFNPGPNVGADLEFRFNQTFSLEGIYTFHRFNGDTILGFTIPDLNVHQVSVNGKVYGSSAPVRPFFNFGGGAYVFDPSATVRGGINVGGGFQFDLTPNVAFDGMYNFHNIFTSGSNTRFSSVQAGIRFRF